MTLGCGNGPNPPSAVFSVRSIFPASGSTDGAISVTIGGTGFRSPATLTLDGLSANVTTITSTSITATIPKHDAGRVDVVVTNPGGESGTLTAAFTYVTPPPPPPPPPLIIDAISPSIGSTAGGTAVTISASGLQPGTTVTIDGVATKAQPNGWCACVDFETPPHAAGTVDIVVTNPDGESYRVAGGYTYAPPESFDFNGEWDGLIGPPYSTRIRFTVRDNLVVSISCGSTFNLTPAPPPSISAGEFSLVVSTGGVITGRIVSHLEAIGRIDVPSCGSSPWFALKKS
jgi:hypothetical protein